MERNSLKHKIIGVTGGASGIGLAIVRKLLAVEAKVAVADLSPAPEELSNNSNVIYTKVNVTSREEVHNWIEEIVEKFGRLDGMCANAGICPVENGVASDDVYRKIIEVCVTGVWNTGTEAYRQFQRQKGGGVLVNTASAAGLKGYRNMAVYSTAKHAVVGFTRCWSLDWASEGIRVNAIAPGFTESPMTDAVIKDFPHVAEHMIAAIPLGRMGKAEELADSALFLLGDTASNITGSILVCDGGMLNS
ncbi:hypothetical protein LTR84_005605 [Exophiala bonariae]|uniref:Uncharacterized protein n=1 Tax=Exophiala bonariae TaxID=1690606 RepID=A0AAV9N6W4_9EURO|nr:hypothetical protein LTR84_005605 [Exophiala bonariae]